MSNAPNRDGALSPKNVPSGSANASNQPAWASTAEAKDLMALVQEGKIEEEIDEKFGPLIQMLALDPQTSAQLMSLLEQRQKAAEDAFTAAREEGLNPRQIFSSGVPDLAAAPFESQIQQLLGAGNFSQFQQYEETIGAHITVNQLADSLAKSANPLTPAQTEAMAKLMASNENSAQLQNQFNRNLISDMAAPIDKLDIKQASSILSPPQVQVFKQQMQQSVRDTNLRTILKSNN
jgi:hypothetical protein